MTAAFSIPGLQAVGRASLKIPGEPMRAFFRASLIAAIIGVPVATAATAHEGWFVRVCPAKTEANRIHLTFSGARQGFSWSWIKGRTLDETDLPRRFRSVAR